MKTNTTTYKAREMLESVDECDGTFASCVKQGFKNAAREYIQEHDETKRFTRSQQTCYKYKTVDELLSNEGIVICTE